MAKINLIELQKHLKGVNYPASKQDVIDKAKKNGADQDVQSALENLSDEQFETPADVKRRSARSTTRSRANGKWNAGDHAPHQTHPSSIGEAFIFPGSLT